MKKRLISALVAIACGGVSQISLAEEFKLNNIYVIGDSLSDAGTYSQYVVPILNGQGITNIPNRMKFTTNSDSALMWNQILGNKLGITVDVNRITAPINPNDPNNPNDNQTIGTPINVGGTNYAEGGARVTLPNTLQAGNNNQEDGVTALSAVIQIDRMLADLQASGRQRFNDNDLVVVWAGANDLLVNAGQVAATTQTAQQAVSNVLLAGNQLLAQIDRLKAAGASNLVVVSIPDLGKTPAFVSQGAQAQQLGTTLTTFFNNSVEAGAAERGAVVIRANQLFSALLADPARYGFDPAVATTPACAAAFQQSSLFCIQGSQPVTATADSEQRIFADGVHPTAATQQILADAAFAGLQAAAANGAMVAAPLTPIRQHSSSLESRLSITALVHQDESGKLSVRPVGHKEWYGGVERGSFDADAQQIQQGLDSTTIVTKIGVDTMLADNWLLGGGISIDKADTDFANNGGGFDTDLFVVSGFTTVALSKQAYLNAALSLGDLSYDVERKFNLGPSQERYSGSPDGTYTSFRVGGGYLFQLPYGWAVNPQLAYTMEEIDLDGYTESQGAASLSFGSTEYKARRVSYGLAVTKSPSSPNGWRPTLRVSFEDDREKEPLRIRMGPDQNTLGTIEAPRPDGSFQLVSLGLGKQFGFGYLHFHASGTFGMNGVDGHSYGVAYKATW